MGRRINLEVGAYKLLLITNELREIRKADVKARKSKGLARLKPKYTKDIKRLDLLITTLVTARKILRGLPRAVQ